MKSNKGFSLVELIVVIAIMAIIAAVAVPAYSAYVTKAETANNDQKVNDAIYAAQLATIEFHTTVTVKSSDDKTTVTIASTAGKTLPQIAGIIGVEDINEESTSIVLYAKTGTTFTAVNKTIANGKVN